PDAALSVQGWAGTDVATAVLPQDPQTGREQDKEDRLCHGRQRQRGLAGRAEGRRRLDAHLAGDGDDERTEGAAGGAGRQGAGGLQVLPPAANNRRPLRRRRGTEGESEGQGG